MSIKCLDCGIEIVSEEKPKDTAKKHNWVYVCKGKWRCTECQKFQENIGTFTVRNKEPL